MSGDTEPDSGVQRGRDLSLQPGERCQRSTPPTYLLAQCEGRGRPRVLAVVLPYEDPFERMQPTAGTRAPVYEGVCLMNRDEVSGDDSPWHRRHAAHDAVLQACRRVLWTESQRDGTSAEEDMHSDALEDLIAKVQRYAALLREEKGGRP